MNLRRSGYSACIGLAVVVACAVSISVPGCAPRASVSKRSSPSISESAWKNQAVSLGAALQAMTGSNLEWSREPAGDVTGEQYVDSLVFVEINSVDVQHRRITFDAEQIYIGDAADTQASRDGTEVPTSPVYVRNAIRHEQTLPIAEDAVVVLQYPSAADPNAGGPTAVSTEVWFQRLAQPQHELDAQMGYWILVDASGEVRTVVEEYNP